MLSASIYKKEGNKSVILRVPFSQKIKSTDAVKENKYKQIQCVIVMIII